jgi:signal transduction histidine kinase
VETARKQNGRSNIAMVLDASGPAVPADPDKLAQLLAIVLGNALKYSPTGSEVMVSSKSDRDEVSITVKDHGPGMPSDFENGLFVGYRRQGGAGNGAHAGGTGLGLPIARQIVEMHGGRIWFETTPGQGTEFHFTLPLRVRPSREMRPSAGLSDHLHAAADAIGPKWLGRPNDAPFRPEWRGSEGKQGRVNPGEVDTAPQPSARVV